MKLFELSQLPFKERFKFVNALIASNSELPHDVKIVYEIFEKTIAWFQGPHNQRDQNLIAKLKDAKEKLPSFFKTIYEIQEKSVIKELPSNERQRIFDDSKEAWCLHYPEFKRISDLMEDFKTNEMLIEYVKRSPPAFIHDKAIEVYKKCIPFKVNLTKKKVSSIFRQHPDYVDTGFTPVNYYCIDKNIVITFLKDYIKWMRTINNLWYEIYYLKQDFIYNSGYNSLGWGFYIEHPDLLKSKADQIEILNEKIITLLNTGKQLVCKHDEAITLEYETNSFEMSFYEREKEIAQMRDMEHYSDEEYCYVYTLECELFVFYVGIAANPKERFEQHIRGAFSNEAHLFKSKFIQKYHNAVKQNIVYEGIRRECKNFERDYIAEFRPLGNMTDGGEG